MTFKTSSTDPKPPQKFKHYKINGSESAASLLLGDNACGIYIYRFSDDTWYVGKTINLKNRHQQHLHEYRHEEEYEGIGLTDMYFMEVDPEKGAEYLDHKETEAIQWADAKGLVLHNIDKTDRPRGAEVANIVLQDGAHFSIPLSRDEMTNGTLEPAVLDMGVSNSLAARAQKLKTAPFYEDLRAAIGEYLDKTVNEAAAGAGKLWSVSALPSTSGGFRLLTLSVSNLETIIVGGSIENGVEIICVNCKRPESDRRIAPPAMLLGGLPRKAKYRVAHDVATYYFADIDSFRKALVDERFLDWCYRLNAELMRKSPTFHTKGFNPIIAADLLG